CVFSDPDLITKLLGNPEKEGLRLSAKQCHLQKQNRATTFQITVVVKKAFVRKPPRSLPVRKHFDRITRICFTFQKISSTAVDKTPVLAKTTYCPPENRTGSIALSPCFNYLLFGRLIAWPCLTNRQQPHECVSIILA